MIIKYIKKDIKDIDRNVACIGNFDGVHKGHQTLINKVIEISNEKNLIPTLITFYPEPQRFFSKEEYKPINTLDERIKLYEEFGIKMLLIIDFNEEVMKKSYQEFQKEYLNNLNIDTLICGFDFTYGYKGKGNIETLKEFSQDNFNLIVIDQVNIKNEKVSSTRIKKEIKNSNYELVNELLGYEYKK